MSAGEGEDLTSKTTNIEDCSELLCFSGEIREFLGFHPEFLLGTSEFLTVLVVFEELNGDGVEYCGSAIGRCDD